MNKKTVRNVAFRIAALIACIVVGARLTAGANQLPLASTAPVVYGHHHLNVTSIDEHKKFWVDGLGGVVATLEGLPTTIIRFPNVLVFLRQQAPKGDMKGTVLPRIGFDVKSVAAATEQLKTAGFAVTKQGSSGTVTTPDGLEVELVESRGSRAPAVSEPGRVEGIGLRDLQFSVEDPDAVSAWYAKTFGAAIGKTAKPRTATLPGLTMVFGLAKEKPAGTQGRVLDHIGFEVKQLEAFCTGLQSKGIKLDRPYTKLPNADLAIAFLTDPWGTYIELTEGLSKVK
jgi:predicted enzyme related to lactoylglutathione lyase